MSDQMPVPLQASGPGFSSFRETDGVRLAPGTWWRTKVAFGKAPDGLEAGTYVLVDKVEVADGAPHTMHVAEPPGAVADDRLGSKHYDRGWRVLAEEFLAVFEPVPEAEALAARQSEIDAVQGRIADLNQDVQAAQGDLMRLASGAGAAPVLLSAPDGSRSGDAGEARQELAARSSGTMADRARAITSVSDRISANAVAMGKATSRVALYYGERSKAALAAVQPALAVAGRLMEHVGTMGLYLGHGVEAQLLVDGMSAPASDKLSLLQRRLFMDEEVLIHLEDGGADIEDVGAFAEHLRSDPALVERIFGAPRAVVAMAARRNDKEYLKGSTPTIRSILDSVLKNQANKATFLLVRDGGRIWIVDLPDDMQGLARLFPTPADLEAPYTKKSWFSEPPTRIGPDSLDYAKATEEFRKLAVHYERVLILLWGLHDRLNLFGPFAEGSEYTGFGDPRLQQERFRLVFDDQSLLGRDFPPYHKWLASKNAGLQSGSRVAVLWRGAMTYQSAPGAVELDTGRDRHREVFKYNPVHSHGVAVVRREGQAMVIDAPVEREILDRDTFDYRMRRMNARVDLSKVEKGRNFSFLVLDDLDPDDIDHYLNTRSERQHYLDYVAVLVLARDAARADLAHEAPACAELLSAAKSGRLPEPAEGWDRAIREAIRDWRAVNRGAPLPLPGAAAWPKVRDILLGKMWIIAGQADDDAVVAAAAALCGASGREPLRLARDGKNRMVVYARNTAVAEAMEPLLGQWPYVDRIVCSLARDGSLAEERSREVIPSKAEMAGERIVHEFAAMKPAMPLGGMRDGRVLRTLVEQAVQACSLRCVISQAEPDDAQMQAVRSKTRTLIRDRSQHRVARQDLVQPAGIIVDLYTEDYDGERQRMRIRIVGYCEDSWLWVARHAGPAERKALEGDILASYRSPQQHIDELPAVGSLPRNRLVFLWELSAKGIPDLLDPAGLCFLPEGGHRPGRHREKTGPESALGVVSSLLGPKDKDREGGKSTHRWMSPQAAAYLAAIPPDAPWEVQPQEGQAPSAP